MARDSQGGASQGSASQGSTGRSSAGDLDRIRRLASELAAADSGPAGELGCALAEAVVGIAGRVDALWDLIVAVVGAAGTSAAASEPPPAEFLQALTSARGPGHQGVRLNIAGQDWVAAVSPDGRPADPARAWAALERLATSSGQAGDDQGDDDDQGDK
jgi:hypothetical protein